MRFKFILAIALILCAFCVLPVNAEIISKMPNIDNLGINPTYNELSVTYSEQEHFLFIWKDLELILSTEVDYDNPYVYYSANIYTDYIRLQDLINDYGNGFYEIEYDIYHEEFGKLWEFTVSADTGDYDIIIENSNNTIELGTINNYNQVFTIGSNQNGIVKNITSYSAYNCYIEQLQTNYVIVRLDEDLTSGTIQFSGNVEYNGIVSQFETSAIFNYNYQEPILPTNNIQAFIQTYDYQNGNMLSGVNLSVYEVIDHDTYAELGQLIYSSINAESQTVLQLKNNTDYFVKNELTGYFAVKNTNYPYFNNEYGYWWSNPAQGSNPLMLYYSKLEPTAQYNANFIVQDVNNNGIAGVTVTMDNSITKISNSIGGLTFNNVSAGTHTFTFVKNGYQSAQRTIDIQLQYAAFTQTLFKDDQIIQPTVSPTAYPTTYPTLSPIDKPSNIMESVSFGFAKIFGVKTVENANYIFALMLILFPAVVAGGITHQALGFIAGGMIGFVFALAVGLIPIWVFFAMCLLAVIYFVLKGGNEGF